MTKLQAARAQIWLNRHKDGPPEEHGYAIVLLKLVPDQSRIYFIEEPRPLIATHFS